jgi:hypothetical protein
MHHSLSDKTEQSFGPVPQGGWRYHALPMRRSRSVKSEPTWLRGAMNTRKPIIAVDDYDASGLVEVGAGTKILNLKSTQSNPRTFNTRSIARSMLLSVETLLVLTRRRLGTRKRNHDCIEVVAKLRPTVLPANSRNSCGGSKLGPYRGPACSASRWGRQTCRRPARRLVAA